MDWRSLVLLMEFASSFISFLVGYYALKGYRATGVKGLLLLYLGFVVLGVGIFLRVVTVTYLASVSRSYPSVAPHLVSIANLAAFLFTLTQIVAYSLFAATYVVQAKNMEKVSAAEIGTVAAAVAPVFRLFFIPQLELVAIILLGFVAVYSFTNWLLKKGSEAALVFFGFGFMLVSHLFFLFMLTDVETFLFLGQTTQLVGFLCLLAMLARVSKTNVERT